MSAEARRVRCLSPLDLRRRCEPWRQPKRLTPDEFRQYSTAQAKHIAPDEAQAVLGADERIEKSATYYTSAKIRVLERLRYSQQRQYR